MTTIGSGIAGRSHARRGPSYTVCGRVASTHRFAPTTQPTGRLSPSIRTETRRRAGVAAWVFGLAVAGWAGTAFAQTAPETDDPNRIGVVSLVNPDATLDRAAALLEPAIGDDILLADRVATDAAGQVHLMLLDKSSFTVGPNSDVTIDRFVYDPETRSGEMAMSAVRGVMRFVGGDLSKDQPVEIRTAIGTLGIRGGILMLDIRDDGGITAIFGYGVELTVETVAGGGAFESITRAGYMVEIAPDGTIGNPVPAPEETVRGILQNLEAPTPQPLNDGGPAGLPDDPGDPVGDDPTAGGGTAGGSVGTPSPQGAPIVTGFVMDGQPITVTNLVESDEGLLAEVNGDLVEVGELLNDTIEQAIVDSNQVEAALADTLASSLTEVEQSIEETINMEEEIAEVLPDLLALFRFIINDNSGSPNFKVDIVLNDGYTELRFEDKEAGSGGTTIDVVNQLRATDIEMEFIMEDNCGTGSSCASNDLHVTITDPPTATPLNTTIDDVGTTPDGDSIGTVTIDASN